MTSINGSNGTSDTISEGSFPPPYTVVVLLGVLAVLIFAANSFVIYLYLNRSELRTITNLCLVFLAVSDLLAAVIVIPIIILSTLSFTSSLNIPSDVRHILLTINDLASRFVAISTVFHLLMVSLERYIMIVFPMNYVRIVNRKRVKACLLFVWCFSVTVILIQLSWLIPLTGKKTSRADLVYSMCTFFGIVVPVFLLLIATYYHIYREVCHQIKSIQQATPFLMHLEDAEKRRQQRNSQAKKDKRLEARAVIIFGVMLCTFVIGWFPYFILGILDDLKIAIHLSMNVSIMLLFARFAVSLINPLLYTFLKADFRNALRKKVLQNRSTLTRTL